MMRRFLLLLVTAALVSAAVQRAVTEANAGLAQSRAGKFESAVQHYRAAIAADPKLPASI